jgi:adenosylhomocysteinase
MTIQTAVLIETLQALGAEVRWASCNIFSTQDHAAAAIAAPARPCSPTRASRSTSTGSTRTASSSGPRGRSVYSNMILDDGGDATLLLHLGARAEKDAACISQADERGRDVALQVDQGEARQGPDVVFDALAQVRGVTEETTTGVKRLYQMAKDGTLSSRPSTSTTRSPRASSTTSTAAASRWSTASSARPT